jgi:hypothetical protein
MRVSGGGAEMLAQLTADDADQADQKKKMICLIRVICG